MKRIILTVMSAAVLSTAAMADTAPATSSATPPAVALNKGDSSTTAAPVAGANSFTKTEAIDRLKTHGYTEIGDLQLDDKSIWRGKAMKDGKSLDVALDYQGNITAQ